MLEFLRKSAGSWVAKGLFVILILSFGVWGIGDVVRSGGTQKPALSVGDVEVSPATFKQAFDQKFNQFRSFLGDQLTRESARQMGLVDATIRELAQSAAMDMLAKDMGVTVSTDAIRAEIARTPAFQGQDGQFSASVFRTKLAQANLSEDAYVSMLSTDMKRERIQFLLAANPSVPTTLAEPLFRHDQERRIAESLEINPAALTITTEPTQDELQKVYQDNIQSFTAPEFRKLTVLSLTSEALKDRVKITDADIEDYYNANKDTFSVPEQRTLSQVRPADQAAAEQIIAKVKAGAVLKDAVASAGAPAPQSLGNVSAGSLPKDIDAAVFALGKGEITSPISTSMGLRLFVVEAILPAHQKPLAEVHDSIATSLQQERAVNMVYEESKTLQDTLGGGANLEEAASKMALPILTIEQTDDQGKDNNGNTAQGMPNDPAFAQAILKAALPLQAGEESTLEDMNSGYFIVRVDSVTPPTPRSLESQMKAVRALWVSQQQKAKATTLAAELVKKAQPGQSLSALANGAAMAFQAHSPITRDGQPVPSADVRPSPLLSPAQVKQLFNMSANDVMVVESTNGPSVIRLVSVAAANPADAKEKMAELRNTIAGSLAQDISSEALEAYSKQFGVTINQATIDKAL